MNRNLVEIALQELGAEDRALLELSVVRGVSDEDIAGLLGVDIARVLIKREEALGRVSALIGEDPEEVLRTMRALPAARWRSDEDARPEPPEAGPEPEPGTEREPQTGAVPEPAPEPGWPEADRGRFRLALLGGLAVTLIVVVVLALTGDDDDDEPAPAAPQAAGGGAAVQPLAGSRAAGSARIEQGRLVMTVRGLPQPASGGYVVWLYNSIADARAIAGARRGSFAVRARLPSGYRRYRFVDVSREAPDGNAVHSGQSVVRVPVARLAP